jgi:hypothetical protein
MGETSLNKLKCISFCLLASVTILSSCSQSNQENAYATAQANEVSAKSDDVNSNVPSTGAVKEEGFTENDAIAMVLKALTKGPDGEPSINFPNKSGETKKVEATIGGKAGTTTNVELTTNVEKKDETFIVKLKKDWNVKVGNKEVVSYWEYQANSKAGVKLLKSEDNDNLIAIIK